MSFLKLSRDSVRLSYQAAVWAPKAPLKTNGGKGPYTKEKAVPLSTRSSPRVPSQQGKQDKGQMVAFVFIGLHRTFGICLLPTLSLLSRMCSPHILGV